MTVPSALERHEMHAEYLRGGRERQMAPHIVYPEPGCPHDGCSRRMQAIDFRLEDHGREAHDALVRAWWDDVGFVGRCPRCDGWIHFTLQSKRSVTADEAAGLPHLPDDWHVGATIL